MKKNILVFPCGSEIGLEIYRSMRYSTHFSLVGASSVDDHGKYVYERYIGDVPFHHDDAFASRIKAIVAEHNIDAIYPAMDAVAKTLHDMAEELPCRVIGSRRETSDICASKAKTYRVLSHVVPTPRQYASPEHAERFPIFIKPDRGYGSRGCLRADNRIQATQFLAEKNADDYLLLEYLPGREWTVDCFSNRHGELMFCAPRGRNRISNGISVNTSPDESVAAILQRYADGINQTLSPRGAWFFQVKQNDHGTPVLLEVAARLGGSSGLFRIKGVNFALLSCFDAFDFDVEIATNDYVIEMDRALNCHYAIDIDFQAVYVDFDDCLIINQQVNTLLVAFLYRCLNVGKQIYLVTRHRGNLTETLQHHRLQHLFDHIYHLKNDECKSTVIHHSAAIFIDDSHQERKTVATQLGIPVFSPDMIDDVSFRNVHA